MNIFYLDSNPFICAKYHCDKHVVKMILEYAQMLSTAHRILDGYDGDILCRATHVNHPCSKWVRSSAANYNWLYILFTELLNEYTYRYGKHHQYEKLIMQLNKAPKNIDNIGFTPPPQCMPDDCKDISVIDAYRKYYFKYKSKMLKWKKRDIPNFLVSCPILMLRESQ